MRFIIYLLILTIGIFAEVPPLSFIAFEKDKWKIIVCEKDECIEIKTEQEPRTYDYNFQDKNVVYIASDKSVRMVTEGKESKLLESRKDAYTEPSFVDDNKRIMLVELINGNSKKTKVISISLEGEKYQTLISQHSTALEPHMQDSHTIYYVNVSCVEGCGKIIQEIWEKDTITGEANQLTLLNALSHQPRVHKKSGLIYFSSAKNGDYHIWSYNMQTAMVKQLTFGNTTDSFPSPYNDGIIFLRKIENHTQVLHLDHEKNLKELIFNKSYTKIRNLKVKQ